MTLFFIIAIGFVTFLSIRSILKSLKKSEQSYEYSRNEMRTNHLFDNNGLCAGSKR